VDYDSGELGDCLRRVLFPGAGEQIDHYEFTTAQLKTMLEVITLVVICAFSVWVPTGDY
jgi:uncharacterized protein (DUF486 family)